MMPTWYVDGPENNRQHYSKHGTESLLQSERRRMELQTDLVTLQRDQRISQAVRLQCRWQELSERERRAQLLNRELLQEFDRAQDTLRNMVTHTSAMNTIRVEYESYLEESFPRWQQQLKEKTLSAQRKRMEQHLKDCQRRMEKGRGEERTTKHPNGATSVISPSHAYIPQNAAAPLDQNRQNGHGGYVQDGYHLSSWLIHGRSHLADCKTGIPYNDHRGNLTQQPADSPLPHDPQSLFPPQPYPVQPSHSYPTLTSRPHTVFQPETPPSGCPTVWAGVMAAAGNIFRFPVSPQTSWTSPSMSDTHGGSIVHGVEEDGQETEISKRAAPRTEGETQTGEKRKDPSHDLDIKPVRLSSGQGESSESSRASSREASKERKERKKKAGGAGRRATDRLSVGVREVVIAETSVSSSVVESSENDEPSVAGSKRSRRSRSGVLANSFSAEESGSHKEVLMGQMVSGSHKEVLMGQMESGNHREVLMGQMVSGSHRQGETSEKAVGDIYIETTEVEEESLAGVSLEEEATREDEDGLEHEVEEENNAEEEEGTSKHARKEQVENENEEVSQKRKEEAQPKTHSVLKREQEEGRGEEEEEDQDGQGDSQEVTRSENEREQTNICQEGELEERAESREEEVCVGNGDESEEDEEGSAEKEEPGEEQVEEQHSQEAEEDSTEGEPEDKDESDSDDSIISRPAHRSSKVLIEEEEVISGSGENYDHEDGQDDKVKGSSWSADPFPDEDDDIESLLAPQAVSQEKQEKKNEEKAVIKPKAIREDFECFSEVDKKLEANQYNESNEFDPFYD